MSGMTTIDPAANTEHWTERAQDVLTRYSEPLLRKVMQQLLKPRNQWPVEELIERGVATLTNAAVIDRRLADLSPGCRKLLAVIGLSRQPVWRVGHLVALLASFGHVEGLTPVLTLLNEGLIHPELPGGMTSLKQFEDWLGPGGMVNARVFVHPAITTRALPTELEIPELPSRTFPGKTPRVSDGLEWLLRTSVAWSRVAGDPLRLTQQHTLFKRELQRFQTDEVLASPFADHLTDLQDPGLFALQLAEAVGVVRTEDGQLMADPDPEIWRMKLRDALASAWPCLFRVDSWDPLQGYVLSEEGGVFPTVTLSAFMLLRSLPDDAWVQAAPIASHIFKSHPAWSATLKKSEKQAAEWVERLFLGVGYPLRLVEALQEGGEWWFRLGDVGRQLLKKEKPQQIDPEFSQTLIVQPNGELIAFRHGLTPELIGHLTRIAVWKNLGAACTMELTAESVYRGLETGLTLADVQRILEQHGTRALPATVLDSLQRWASKRERITVWAAATLLEFNSAEDLETAFTRGLISTKLTDRIGIAVNSGDELDYKHFRLVGNRDYESRPQKCIAFDPDGVTFTIDAAQSDLILEAELGLMAAPLPNAANGARRYRLTPESLKLARVRGIGAIELEQWALDRSGEPLSAAARMLAVGSQAPATSRMRLVVQFPDESIADGVLQWPETATLVEERLGPNAVAVRAEDLPGLVEKLREAGVTLQALEAES